MDEAEIKARMIRLLESDETKKNEDWMKYQQYIYQKMDAEIAEFRKTKKKPLSEISRKLEPLK